MQLSKLRGCKTYLPNYSGCAKKATLTKYINIPSEKYIYVPVYVYICVFSYLCKMDEHRSYAGLS